MTAPDLSSLPDRPTSPAAKLKRGVAETARWSLRTLIIVLAAIVAFEVLSWAWSIVLPLLLAFLLAAVLWAPTAFLRRFMPDALAATIVVLGSILLVFGLIAVMIPLVGSDIGKLKDQGLAGLDSVRDLLSKPPFNINDDQIGQWIDQGLKALQDNTSAIASQVGAVLGSVSGAVVTIVITLFLVFFMMKDGPKFLGWLRSWIGDKAGGHAEALTTRIFEQLGKFLWSQALVSLVDAVFIGIGLAILGVPLVIPLALVTFIGGFIPIVGAFATGALAVLVALVSNGVGDALWVVAIVVVVQQLEGNVLSPMLVGKAMELHPAVVLGVITVGGSVSGITGAFLAVPLTATGIIIARYVRQQLRPTLVVPPTLDKEPPTNSG